MEASGIKLDIGGLADELAKWNTLPAEWYTDPAVLDLERELVFKRSWQYVGLAEDVEKPGQYFSCAVQDVPVVVTRDKAGSLNAFVNVCRHRHHLVAEGRGSRSSLQCPYHAWTYSLDGSLRAAPRCEREPNFDKAQYGLIPVRVEEWGPMVFVNLDADAAPLTEWMGLITESLVTAGCDVDSLRLRRRTQFDIQANWKVVAENYLECYHCAVAHPGYNKFADTSSEGYAFKFDSYAFVSETEPLQSIRDNQDMRPYDIEGDISTNQINFLWPNFALMAWPGVQNLVIYSFAPVTTHRTVGTFEYFFAEDVGEDFERDLTEFLDQIGDEDVPLVESVQRGLNSGIVRHGRLLADEGQIRHFDRLVYQALTARSHHTNGAGADPDA